MPNRGNTFVAGGVILYWLVKVKSSAKFNDEMRFSGAEVFRDMLLCII